MSQCRAVAAKLAFFPLSVDEFFALEGKTVRIWNRLDQVIELADDWQTPREAYLPVPPLYALGKTGGVPVEFDRELSPALLKHLRAYEGSEAGVATIEDAMTAAAQRPSLLLRLDRRVRYWTDGLAIGSKKFF